MNQPMGTPKTLVEAINNGISESCPADLGLEAPDVEKLVAAIAPHVLDYLANKFAVPMMKNAPQGEEEYHQAIGELFAEIANREKPSPELSKPAVPGGPLSSAFKAFRILKG